MTSFNSLKQTVQYTASRLIDKAIWISLITVAIVMIGWIGFHSISFNSITLKTTSEVRNLIISSVQNTTELTTANTSSKATITVKQEKKFWRVPVGDTNLVYEGVGNIRAGINLAEMEVIAADFNQRQIQIKLPAPHISDVGLDIGRSSTLANYRHWLAPKADIEMQERAQRDAMNKIKAEACANHILEAASSNAEQLIRNTLASAGFETIQMDTQPIAAGTCSIGK